MSKKQEQKYIENLFAEMLIEMPMTFSIGEGEEKRFFNIWPKSIGKRVLLERMRAQLPIDHENAEVNPLLETMRVCKECPDTVARIIAIATARNKTEVYDERRTQECITIFREGLTNDEMATLLLQILQDETADIEKVKKHYGMDKEQKKREVIARLRKKNAKNAVGIGGCTLYGSLVAFCCEKFGMTVDETLWNISYASLILMYSDYADSIYLSDDEVKRLPAWVRQGRDSIKVDGDNKEEIIKAINSQNWE